VLSGGERLGALLGELARGRLLFIGLGVGPAGRQRKRDDRREHPTPSMVPHLGLLHVEADGITRR
jgi:hypothetical protein